jgi:hypothetical protein
MTNTEVIKETVQELGQNETMHVELTELIRKLREATK